MPLRLLPRGRLVVTSLFLLAFLARVSSDLFTSINDLQRLLTANEDIPELIDDYIAQEKERLQSLKRSSTHS